MTRSYITFGFAPGDRRRIATFGFATTGAITPPSGPAFRDLLTFGFAPGDGSRLVTFGFGAWTTPGTVPFPTGTIVSLSMSIDWFAGIHASVPLALPHSLIVPPIPPIVSDISDLVTFGFSPGNGEWIATLGFSTGAARPPVTGVSWRPGALRAGSVNDVPIGALIVVDILNPDGTTTRRVAEISEDPLAIEDFLWASTVQ